MIVRWIQKLNPTLNTILASAKVYDKRIKYAQAQQMIIDKVPFRKIKESLGISLGLLTKIKANIEIDRMVI